MQNPITTGHYHCPLCSCSGHKALVYRTRKGRLFWHCRDCDLIFVDPGGRPTAQHEKNIYQHHQNSPAHSGYVTFLRRIIDPALPLLTPAMLGLDYGCGPGPTLSVLLAREGINCINYDPLFFPTLPPGPFNFIFATECFEHFHNPARELKQLRQLLHPDGYLFVMTSLWHEDIDLRTWRYLCDPTHVSFYHRRTVDHICAAYGFALLACYADQVLLLQKKERPTG